jgi:hypothetical protein
MLSLFSALRNLIDDSAITGRNNQTSCMSIYSRI